MPCFQQHTPCQAQHSCFSRVNGIPHTFRVRQGRKHFAESNPHRLHGKKSDSTKDKQIPRLGLGFLNPFLSWIPSSALRIVADYYAFVKDRNTAWNFWWSFLNIPMLWEANVTKWYGQHLLCLFLPMPCKFKYLEVLLQCCLQGMRRVWTGASSPQQGLVKLRGYFSVWLTMEMKLLWSCSPLVFVRNIQVIWLLQQSLKVE